MVLSLPFQEAIWCVPFERDEFLLSYGDTIINLLGDFHAPYIVEVYRNGYSIYGAGPLPYIVEAYRNGYSIYGAGPLSEICADHLFYEWPERMFREFDESYGAFMHEVRGPGTGVTISPLINLVLSISEKRHEIPQILVHLREDYAGSRQRT